MKKTVIRFRLSSIIKDWGEVTCWAFLTPGTKTIIKCGKTTTKPVAQISETTRDIAKNYISANGLIPSCIIGKDVIYDTPGKDFQKEWGGNRLNVLTDEALYSYLYVNNQ